ncbi:MAG: hypothetical protein QF673_01045 [Candidatus Hydrothermarchaeota archaeon]|nr:hypothetical protein [Candidatus Hydrothermarchaeota archaeon]
MKPLILGLGRAGCRIASLFFAKENFTGVLLDTDRSELHHHRHKYRILLGEALLDGNGLGKNLGLGREVIEGETHRIVERLDSIGKGVDCYLVISGLGGGTGGAVGVLLKELKRSYTEPVYYAGVLPSREDHPAAMSNFGESFKEAWMNCDALFPIDNDSLKGKQRLRGAYAGINERIYECFSTLFEIGEYGYRRGNDGSVLSTRDVINTLSGLSALGLAASDPRTLTMIESGETGIDKPEVVVSLTKEAVDSLLLSGGIEGSQKALVVVVGPKKYLDFLGSIPARLWVEKNISGIEVRGGDLLLHRRPSLEVMVLVSGMKKSMRIQQLYQIGKTQLDKDAFAGRLASTFERLDSLKKKVREVEEEFRDFYDALKGLKEK